MRTLKRLTVWLLEKIVEACLLGCLVSCLFLNNASYTSLTAWGRIPNFLIFGLVVSVALFLHGYYLTTAFFGVVSRSARSWVYPTTTCALFLIHTRIVFMHAGADFTPETRAMELPIALGGAVIAFSSASAGNYALRKWTRPESNSNAYVSALGLAILLFALANIAHFLRPTVGSDAFRSEGLPFTFYREGGFMKEWVWQPGKFVWYGMIADLAVFAAVVLLLGKALQKSSSAMISRKNYRGSPLSPGRSVD